jgi:hypothetical protein
MIHHSLTPLIQGILHLPDIQSRLETTKKRKESLEKKVKESEEQLEKEKKIFEDSMKVIQMENKKLQEENAMLKMRIKEMEKTCASLEQCMCDEARAEVSPIKKTGDSEVNGEGEPLKKKKSQVSSVIQDSLLYSSLALSVTCGVSSMDRSRHGPSENKKQMECTTSNKLVDPNKFSGPRKDDAQMENTSICKHTANLTKLSDSVHHSPSSTESSPTTSTTQPSRNSEAPTCDVHMEHNELESMGRSTPADSPLRSPSRQSDRAGLVRSPLHKKPELESPVCGLDSCPKLCGKNKKGKYFAYCSRYHRKLAAERNEHHKPGTYILICSQ